MTLIGEYYADVLNGLAFIDGRRGGFLVRIGWFDAEGKYQNTALWHNADRIDFGPANPQGTYGELGWRVGECQIWHRWRRVGDTVVADISASQPITLVLEAGRSWKTYVTHYRLTDHGFTGEGRPSGCMQDEPVQWALQYDRDPQSTQCHSYTTDVEVLAKAGHSRDYSPGREAAAVFELTPDQPLRYAAGFGELPAVTGASESIDQAAQKYADTRCTATGAWGDFIAPMMNVMHHSKVYNFETGQACHTITRSWCRGDGHNLFEWDSLFNAVMACIEDPAGAMHTVRCIFLQQQTNGLVPSYSGPGWGISWDRSQPPVGGMCVSAVYKRSGDREFLAEMFPKLLQWHDWWFARREENDLPHRDGNDNGLLNWGTERDGNITLARWESGLDDSPMYDLVNMNTETRTMELDDVGLSTLWAVDAAYLAELADELGLDDTAQRLRDEAEAMKPRIQTLWNDDLGTYSNKYWSDTSRCDKSMGDIVPVSALTTPDGQPGLLREVFHDVEMTQKRDETIDKTVDFYAGIPTDDRRNPTYGARWTGFVTPPESGQWTFSVHHLNGARLYIDGELLVEHWKADADNQENRGVRCTKPLQLEAGKSYAIRVEYGQFAWHQRFQLGWYKDAPPVRSLLSDVLSPTCYYPMMLELPNKEQGDAMLQSLRDRFWGEWVCPSIDRTHPSFYSGHYWRGKIWAPMNYLLFKGLQKYAPAEELNMFAAKGVKLFMRNWINHGWCNENFWADGEGGSMPHYTWGAMLCLIGMETAQLEGVTADVTIKEYTGDN